MPSRVTRREFLARAGVAATGAALPAAWVLPALGAATRPKSRVAIVRDDALLADPGSAHRVLLARMLDAAMQRLTSTPDATAAWARFFKPNERVGIKVNTLGLSTSSYVVDAIVAGLRKAGLSAERIIIWDRFDVELDHAGFRLNKSASGVQCRGTDAESIGSGYQRRIESSGRIGSCYSRIVAEQIDALISVPVLKDHNLAGASLGMKNFYGAIHNPNKYHEDNCDPFVADVVSHPYVRSKWRLTICDGTRAQYHAGPARHPGFSWPFAGMIVSSDVVAADAVAADLLDAKRLAMGFKSLAEDGRPPRYIATAAARGLGVADLTDIERIEV